MMEEDDIAVLQFLKEGPRKELVKLELVKMFKELIKELVKVAHKGETDAERRGKVGKRR